MFTNQARVIVSLMFLALAAFFAWQHTYELTAVAILLMGMVIWGYFKEGTVVLAAKHFHNKDFDRTERLLKQIQNPNWLGKKRRGFYEFIMGGVCLNKRDYEHAEQHFELAAQYPLRSVNDHVAALVHVATISYRNGNYDKANAYLQLAEKHRDTITAKMREVLNTLKNELSKKG